MDLSTLLLASLQAAERVLCFDTHMQPGLRLPCGSLLPLLYACGVQSECCGSEFSYIGKMPYLGYSYLQSLELAQVGSGGL